MSLPAPPAVPAPPIYQSVQVKSAQQPPTALPTTPSVTPASSYSASDLSANSSSTQNNSNLTNNRIVNTAVYNQNLQGSETQVGNIKVQSAQIYFNASYNPNYGDSVFTGGIVIPVGGRTAYRSAMRISEAEADGAVGNLCMSVYKNGMTKEMIDDLYGKRGKKFYNCINPNPSTVAAITEKVRAGSDDRDAVISELRAEIQRIRAELDAAKAMRLQQMPSAEAVPGLW